MTGPLRAAGVGVLLLALAAAAAGCDAPPTAPAASVVTTAAPPATGAAPAFQPPLTSHRDGTRSGRVDGVYLRVGAPPGRYGGCQPEEVFTILQELTGAIATDPARAASFAKDDFDWYSASENGNQLVPARHAAAYDPASFRTYLEQRRRQYERLRLVALAIGGDGNFQLRLVRVANDLPPGQGGRHRVAEGKGKVNCERRSVVAFSHAMFPVEPDYRSWRGLFGTAPAADLKAAAAQAFAALRREA